MMKPVLYCDPVGIGYSTNAELMALLFGLRELKAMGRSGCLVEGDSKVVVSWALGHRVGSWHPLHLIQEVRSLIQELGVSLCHVTRD